jgi:hypothetical protein
MISEVPNVSMASAPKYPNRDSVITAIIRKNIKGLTAFNYSPRMAFVYLIGAGSCEMPEFHTFRRGPSVVNKGESLGQTETRWLYLSEGEGGTQVLL